MAAPCSKAWRALESLTSEDLILMEPSLRHSTDPAQAAIPWKCLDQTVVQVMTATKLHPQAMLHPKGVRVSALRGMLILQDNADINQSLSNIVHHRRVQHVSRHFSITVKSQMVCHIGYWPRFCRARLLEIRLHVISTPSLARRQSSLHILCSVTLSISCCT